MSRSWEAAIVRWSGGRLLPVDTVGVFEGAQDPQNRNWGLGIRPIAFTECPKGAPRALGRRIASAGIRIWLWWVGVVLGRG